MQVTRIYSGDDGQSHFEELDLPLQISDVGGLSGPIPVESIFFRSTFEVEPSTFEVEPSTFEVEPSSAEDGPRAHTWDYHVAPRRQFALHLVGVTEIEVGDGTSRRFGPGDLLLADDLTGQGHISREVEGPRLQVFAVLAPEVDLDRWRG